MGWFKDFVLFWFEMGLLIGFWTTVLLGLILAACGVVWAYLEVLRSGFGLGGLTGLLVFSLSCFWGCRWRRLL